MSDKAREQLEAEAGSILLQRAVHVTSVNVVAPLLADWAEGLQREDRAEIERLRAERDKWRLAMHNGCGHELAVLRQRAEAAEAGQNHTACSRALAEAEDEVANWKARAEAAEAAHSKELAAHCHTSLKLAEAQAEQEITQACNRRQFDRAEDAETDRDRYAREANEWEHKTAEAWERRDAAEAKTAKLVEAGDWLCDLTTNGDAQKAWAAAKASEGGKP